jgi:hypothetical protein
VIVREGDAVPGGVWARSPGAVPDEPQAAGTGIGGQGGDGRADVWRGADTDADGRTDTLLTVDDAYLLVHTDLDGDGLADRVLRIGPDGAVDEVAAHPASDGADAGPALATGSADATWPGLLGRLFGPAT